MVTISSYMCNHIWLLIYGSSYMNTHICMHIYELVSFFWDLYPILRGCKRGVIVNFAFGLWQPGAKNVRCRDPKFVHRNFPFISVHIWEITYGCSYMHTHICAPIYGNTYMGQPIWRHIYEHNFGDNERNPQNTECSYMYTHIVANMGVYIRTFTNIYES